jgi:hypothetical protein
MPPRVLLAGLVTRHSGRLCASTAPGRRERDHLPAS